MTQSIEVQEIHILKDKLKNSNRLIKVIGFVLLFGLLMVGLYGFLHEKSKQNKQHELNLLKENTLNTTLNLAKLQEDNCIVFFTYNETSVQPIQLNCTGLSK